MKPATSAKPRSTRVSAQNRVELTGQAYLTTGYDGAPFGLLVRTLAEAGPFDLGWVNVRSRINVNPEHRRR